jgi:hypothetical protein
MRFLDKKEVNSHIITFLWDSIGSIGCFQGAVSNTNNNQWTAGALKENLNQY